MKDHRIIRVALVDDHPLVHQGIAAIIGLHGDLELVGAATNVAEGLELLRASPDVALIDLNLGGQSGLILTQEGRAIAPNCRFIILTSVLDAEVMRQAMELQVSGYILKDALPDEMIQAIRLVARGRPYMDPAVMEAMLGSTQTHQRTTHMLEPLTQRQKDVLIELGKGLGTREIADKLCVSESTVKKHISEVLAKLGLTDRTQAALYAVASGLVRIEDLVFANGIESSPGVRL